MNKVGVGLWYVRPPPSSGMEIPTDLLSSPVYLDIVSTGICTNWIGHEIQWRYDIMKFGYL